MKHNKRNPKWPPLAMRAEKVCPHCGAYALIYKGFSLEVNNIEIFYGCNNCNSAVRRKYKATLESEEIEPNDYLDGGLST